MKKKTIITLLILGFFTFKTQAQEPTKQETIDWITSKFLNNLNKTGNYVYEKSGRSSYTRTYNSCTYNSGIITIYSDLHYEENGSSIVRKIINKFDLNGLSNADFFTTRLTLYFKSGYYNYSSDGRNIETDSGLLVYRDYSITANEEGLLSIINWESEPDLFNRFAKAVQTLISFNTTKQKF